MNGHSEQDLERKFDARWYVRRYPDVANSRMDPWEHFDKFGRFEGRESSAEPIFQKIWKRYGDIRAAVIGATRRAGGVRLAIVKVIDVATRDTWSESDFDESFYLQQYPDVRRAGVDAKQHFFNHGRSEGRQGSRHRLPQFPGGISFDDTKATILVVSHEASLTGAPVLGLNLVRGLNDKYNVVSLLINDGPLTEDFAKSSYSVAGPVRPQTWTGKNDAMAQLAELHGFKFAIINSIESSSVLEQLAKRSIPTVVLIHEFASYTRPRSAFGAAFFWADEVVFSTGLTYQNALAEYPELTGKDCEILAQGRSIAFVDETDSESRSAELARVRASLRPPSLPVDTIIVIGAGFVHIRKGVDLFIECARRVVQSGIGRPCRFVWIGKGYDAEHDMGYSAYLLDQIRRSGLEGYVHFIDDTSEIEEVYRSADILLLSSRLDPLPNVAIDAMSHGLPVICFNGTTGIADILASKGLSRECVAPYLDTSEMAARLLAFCDSRELLKRVGSELQAIAREKFDMPRYIEAIERIALRSCDNVAREQESSVEIYRSGLLKYDYSMPANFSGASMDTVRWGYVRPWSSGLGRRKPFPGFHPGIFGDLQPDGSLVDPFTRYLRAGCPNGPWNHEVIFGDEIPLPVAKGLRVALHLHVYYPDLLCEIVVRLKNNRARPDLFVSVPTEGMVDEVRRQLSDYQGSLVVKVVPNRGRDIGPMLTAFGSQLATEYDILGHIHTKKTMDVADTDMTDQWRYFLLENMIGSKSAMADIILGRMCGDATIGMVFPDDPNVVGWGGNLPDAEKLASSLGIGDALPHHFVFPIGTMFWARVESIKPLFDLDLRWEDYPSEPLPYDGSMLHALERMLPIVAESKGFRTVLTHVHGVSR